MPPSLCTLGTLFVDAEDSLRVKLEKKLESFGFDGVYGSASSTTSFCPGKGEGVPLTFGGVAPLGLCFGGWVGAGAERSGVDCDEENFELMLEIHDALRELPPGFSELLRLSSCGRLG